MLTKVISPHNVTIITLWKRKGFSFEMWAQCFLRNDFSIMVTISLFLPYWRDSLYQVWFQHIFQYFTILPSENDVVLYLKKYLRMLKFGWNSGQELLVKEDCQHIVSQLLLSPLGKGNSPSFVQIRISFIQGFYI